MKELKKKEEFFLGKQILIELIINIFLEFNNIISNLNLPTFITQSKYAIEPLQHINNKNSDE